MSDPARKVTGTHGGRSAGLEPARAAELLAALEAAHAELAAAIGILDEIAAAELDPARVAHARWRLGSARRRRRAAAGDAYDALRGVASGEDAAMLARLEADDARRLRESALHVGEWTSERIAADWPGYGAASAPLRAALTARIAAERALLRPILERLSRGA